MMSGAFPKNPKNIERDINYMMELLRRVYNAVEMCHLTDYKLSVNYVKDINFPRGLGDDIFNYLKAKDQTFIDTVIKRQNRFRKRMKNKSIEQKSNPLEGIKIYQQSISNKLNSFTSADQQLSIFHSIDPETIKD